MNDLKKFITIITFTFLLSACATTFDVATDHDESFDFNNKHSFAVVTPEKMETTNDDLVRDRIERALISELTLRGFVKADEAKADILVSYFTTSMREKDVQTYQNYNSYYNYSSCYRCGRMGGYGGYSMPSTEVRVVDYTRGVLMIDIIDPATKSLKWRGQTTAKFTTSTANKMNVEERTELVNNAVKAILNRYPPGVEAK